MKSRLAATALASALALGGCVTPQNQQGAQWKGLEVGYVVTPGLTIQGDGIKLASGQAFTPSFEVDCQNLHADPVEFKKALQLGARNVTIRKQGEKAPFYGVLALCKVHKSATGPAARGYNIQIPPDRFDKARGGLISTVGESTTIAGYAGSGPGAGEIPPLAALMLGVPVQSPSQQRAAPADIETPTWILWMTDRGPTFLEALNS